MYIWTLGYFSLNISQRIHQEKDRFSLHNYLKMLNSHISIFSFSILLIASTLASLIIYLFIGSKTFFSKKK